MKNLPSRYFSGAQEYANEEFMGLDGFESFDADDMPFDADDMPFGADGDDDFAYATKPASGVSQPYVIEIENTTTTNISNAIILDAALKQNNFAISGASITYGLGNITYGQFLSTLLSKTFKVGQLRLIASNASSSVASTQVLTTTTISTKQPNGNEITKSFLPQFDNYQQINNQTDIYYPFLVDELTKITFATLYASTTLKVYLYPAAVTDKFKQLKDRGNASQYRNPGINPLLRGK